RRVHRRLRWRPGLPTRRCPRDERDDGESRPTDRGVEVEVSSERAALTWIERCGGKVERRPEGHYHGPGISVKLLRYAFGQPGMPKNPVTDARLELLAAIEGLDRLELTCTGQITTAGFAALARLPGLRCLDISGLALNAGMLRELAACPKLTELGARGNDLTPGGLREVAGVPS